MPPPNEGSGLSALLSEREPGEEPTVSVYCRRSEYSLLSCVGWWEISRLGTCVREEPDEPEISRLGRCLLVTVSTDPSSKFGDSIAR